MARRNPPPRRSRGPRALRPAAVAVLVALGAALASAIAAPGARAEPPPDLARARELYRSAEAAMNDGRYDDAARDYGAAYELSADPALFYKIGRASERGGKCDVALVYYARYLREGKPTEQFTALTQARIAACGGAAGPAGAPSPAASAGAGGAATGPGDASGPPGGAAAGPATAAGTAAHAPTRAPPSPAGPPAAASPGGPRSAGVAAPPTGAGSTGTSAPPTGAGSAATVAPPTRAAGAEGGTASPQSPAGTAADPSAAAAALVPPTREKVAWLMGGGAIALVTLGGVLAYAASSSENNVRDLYAGFAGQPPMFDAQTRKRYDDLVDEGRSYQHLSWAAFGLAGAAAVGVVVLFTVGRHDEPAPAPAVTPVVGPRGAGVSVRF